MSSEISRTHVTYWLPMLACGNSENLGRFMAVNFKMPTLTPSLTSSANICLGSDSLNEIVHGDTCGGKRQVSALRTLSSASLDFSSVLGRRFAHCRMWSRDASTGTLTSRPVNFSLPNRKMVTKLCFAILSVRLWIASEAVSGKAVPRLARALVILGSSGFTRMSFAAGNCAIKCSSSFRTVGTVKPQPISTQTSRSSAASGLLSIDFNHATYLFFCTLSRSRDQASSGPNIKTAGRATLPHFGHFGNAPLTRCDPGFSSRPRLRGARQMSGRQSSEHCSHFTAPCTSTMRSSCKPDWAQWLSILDVTEKPSYGAAFIHDLTMA
mmetsp:Transcript_90633/g.173854  ORF Transcript_90633/g.173854 Transcript_90633/m.173854 type:complete len:324 (-) Transcript_90633:271-1242(-)